MYEHHRKEKKGLSYFDFLGKSLYEKLVHSLRLSSKSDARTFHFTDMNEKNDVGVAKLNKRDLSLFATTNPLRSKRPFEVKPYGAR
jgi:hypothetical protein